MGLSDWAEKTKAKALADKAALALAATTTAATKATKGWTLPLVIRTYGAGADGEALLERESALFIDHGYEPMGVSEDGGHIHAGRLILTGGLSIFAGKAGIRSGGKRTVTWRLAA